MFILLKMKNLASIVIPTFNRKEELRKCLSALSNQSYNKIEIIVIDDGSTDNTEEMVKKEFKNIKFFKQNNTGPSIARNNGIKKAKGDFILFTDSDCVPDKYWVEELVKGFNEKINCVGGKTIDQKTKGIFTLVIDEQGIEN